MPQFHPEAALSSGPASTRSLTAQQSCTVSTTWHVAAAFCVLGRHSCNGTVARLIFSTSIHSPNDVTKSPRRPTRDLHQRHTRTSPVGLHNWSVVHHKCRAGLPAPRSPVLTVSSAVHRKHALFSNVAAHAHLLHKLEQIARVLDVVWRLRDFAAECANKCVHRETVLAIVHFSLLRHFAFTEIRALSLVSTASR